MDQPQQLILFDGICGLCHGWVRFVIRHDRGGLFKFASMQSDSGQTILARLSKSKDSFETLLYIENDLVYEKSRAFMRIVRHLSPPVRWLSVLSVVPTVVADFVYDQIARRRYRLFGMREECSLTEGDNRERFI